MSLTPLLDADPEIRIHAVAALAAFGLGLFQFASVKGATAHRVIGWLWVVLMATVALSSLFVNTTCTFGPFSWIHLLTLVTLVTLPLAVLAARRHQTSRHATMMISLFAGALVVAGGFTFVPGRIMHDVAFGGASHHPRCFPRQG